jgi:prepilin-type N-terminal cleavage/methylation domain-containing protein
MKRQGFTLLELAVATAIFAIVVAATYSLFDSARGITTRAEFRAQLFQSARAALQAVEDDLRGAVLLGAAYDTGFIGTNVGSEKEPLDKLEFISVNRHSGAPYDVTVPDAVRGIDVCKVSYMVEADEKRKPHGLLRERPLELTPPGGPVHRDEDVTGIADDVAYVNFRYFDNGQWVESWDSTQTRKLPKAVEVTVYIRGEWRGETIVEPFTSRFYLPVGAETPEKTQ